MKHQAQLPKIETIKGTTDLEKTACMLGFARTLWALTP